MIRKTNLGAIGPKVGVQGLGCLNLTGYYGRQFDERLAISTVHQALDLGVTLLDTADSYGSHAGPGFGANEAFLSKAIRDRRSALVLATKFGFVNPSVGGVASGSIRGDPRYVRSACEASLRRLGVEHIDLYYCHRVDPKIPVEDTVGAMAELVTAGKVRFLGLSAVSAEILSRAASVWPITALESEWSLWTRDIEDEVLPLARRLGIGIVPYAPLGRGFLTGQIRSASDLAPDDYRRESPRFQGANFTRNLELVDHIHQLAHEKGCTTTQLALAWLHAQGEDVVPIPGADRPGYVSENVGAVDVRLRPDELAAIDSVFPLGAAAGARYADMSQVNDAARLTNSSDS